MGKFHGRFSWESFMGQLGSGFQVEVVNINTNRKTTHDDSVRKRAGDVRPTGQTRSTSSKFSPQGSRNGRRICISIQYCSHIDNTWIMPRLVCLKIG